MNATLLALLTVPFATATASAAPIARASSRSKASTSGPRMKKPESSTRATAASSSGRIAATWARKSTNGWRSPML